MQNYSGDNKAIAQYIFSAAIERSGAHWLHDADLLVRSPDEIPEDALTAADALGLQTEDAYREIQVVRGKVDTEERMRIGNGGELAMMKLLSESTDATIEHVAAKSDGYGYDIAVHSDRESIHLEIKSTTRRNRLTIHISRNEYETMRTDTDWQLIALRLNVNLTPLAISTVPTEWIESQVPCDRSRYGRWESCRLEISANILIPGIPRINSHLIPGSSNLLNGEAGW
ncbi:DUF3883 domain-containing protein [Rhodococcus erythropolis]|nr:DUF3883 domain-containing protein [Rhodococcus erythropolis]